MVKRVLVLAASSLALHLASGELSPASAQAYTYDAHGRLTTATFASGKVVTYCYDDAGNRTRYVVATSVSSCTPPPPPPPPPPPSPPVAVDDGAFTDTGVAVLINVLANDSDPNGDPFSITGIGPVSPAGGTATQSGNSISFIAMSMGSYSFTYTISDGISGSDTATVNVLVLDPDPCAPFGC